MSGTLCVIVLPTSASVLIIYFPHSRQKNVFTHELDHATPHSKPSSAVPHSYTERKK